MHVYMCIYTHACTRAHTHTRARARTFIIFGNRNEEITFSFYK